MCGCFACIYLHVPLARRQEEAIRSTRNVVTDSSESLCGAWESNLGSLEEQPILLTAKPSLQPLRTFYFWGGGFWEPNSGNSKGSFLFWFGFLVLFCFVLFCYFHSSSQIYLWTHTSKPEFYVVTDNPNSCPHAYETGT